LINSILILVIAGAEIDYPHQSTLSDNSNASLEVKVENLINWLF
jgi:hypothetical protein